MVRCEICKSPLLFLIFSGFVELHQPRWNDRFCMSVHDECEIKHPSSVTRQRNFRPLIADTDKWDEILAWHAGPSPLANIGCDIYSILSRQTVFTRHSLCSIVEQQSSQNFFQSSVRSCSTCSHVLHFSQLNTLVQIHFKCLILTILMVIFQI